MIEFVAENDPARVQLSGNLEVHAAMHLQRVLGEATASGGPVIIDATALDQLHTACAQVLLAAKLNFGAQVQMHWDLRSDAASWLAEAGLLEALVATTPH